MDNETIYLYDILKAFGAEGVKEVLAYFYDQRVENKDFADANLCMEDLLLNTRLEYVKDVKIEDGFATLKDGSTNRFVLLNNGHQCLVEVY